MSEKKRIGDGEERMRLVMGRLDIKALASAWHRNYGIGNADSLGRCIVETLI